MSVDELSWNLELRTTEENGRRKKITYINNPKPRDKMIRPNNARRLLSRNYNRRKNGREKE